MNNETNNQPILTNQPRQGRLDRCGLFRYVIAIQAHAPFQPQGVTRRQPDWFDSVVSKKMFGQVHSQGAGNTDFESILTGVTATSYADAERICIRKREQRRQ